MVVFTENSPYKIRAKFLAIGWTLLIFILCFLPGNEIPKLNIPFIDKWAHMVLFAVFAFLWLCASPSNNKVHLLVILLVSIFVGWLVEYIQGAYVPGRFQDQKDTLADGVGGLIGVLCFYLGHQMALRKHSQA